MSDWHSILTDYGVMVPDKDQFNIHCPFHSDARESCSINIEKQVWICHAGWGQGHLKYFLHKISGKSWKEIDEIVETQEWTLDIDLFDDTILQEEDTGSFELIDSLCDIPKNHWIYKRDFTTSTLERWGCKSNQYNDLVIPVKNHESIISGWITRRMQSVPKYLFSKGFKKSKSLFGIDQLTEVNTLFMVEGALDAMWLNQNGYPSVSIFGASLSGRQIEMISSLNPPELVLCLDNDHAGRKGISKATLDMQDRFMLSYIKLPNRYKDVQDIRDLSQLSKVINNRTLW